MSRKGQTQRKSGNRMENGDYADKTSTISQATTLILSGDVVSADSLLHNLAHEPSSMSHKMLHNSLIHACAKAADPAAAAWVLGRMMRVGLHPNIVSYNSIIDACAKAADVRLAKQWFESALEAGMLPNNVTFNTLINACSRARDAVSAEMWMRKMIDSGIVPCHVSFSNIIDAFAKVGNLDKAEFWFAHLSDFGLAPDAIMFNTMVNACAKAGNPAKAEQWLVKMCNVGLVPDGKTYNSVINACSRGGWVARAEHWFGEMERTGFNIDNITFGSIIHASANVGDVARASRWFQDMLRRGIPPNVICLNTMLHACAQSSDYESAVKWFDQFHSLGFAPNRVSFNSMTDAAAKFGTGPTRFWLQKMVSCGLHPDNITFYTLLRACGRDGDDRPRPELEAAACDMIVQAYQKSGSTRAAKPWLQRRDQALAGLAVGKSKTVGCEQTVGFAPRAREQGDEHHAAALAVPPGLPAPPPGLPAPRWLSAPPEECWARPLPQGGSRRAALEQSKAAAIAPPAHTHQSPISTAPSTPRQRGHTTLERQQRPLLLPEAASVHSQEGLPSSSAELAQAISVGAVRLKPAGSPAPGLFVVSL